MNKLSYALGLGFGRQLAQMGTGVLNIDDFSQAIKDILSGFIPLFFKLVIKLIHRKGTAHIMEEG